MAAQRLVKFGFIATSAPALPPLHLLSRGSRLPVRISRVAPLASSIPQEPTQRSSYSVPEPCTKKQTFPKGVSSVAGRKMRASACSKPSIEKPQLRQKSPKPASTASEVFNRKAARDNLEQTTVVDRWIVRARHVNGARSPEGSRQFELEDRLLAAEEKYFSFQDSD